MPMSTKAAPLDAYSEVKHGNRGFVGDFVTHGGCVRLFAEPDESKVVGVPVHDTDAEFEVEVRNRPEPFMERFWNSMTDALT